MERSEPTFAERSETLAVGDMRSLSSSRATPVPVTKTVSTRNSTFDYSALQILADRHHDGLQDIKALASGGVAGCVAKSAVAPLSRVTILMQVQSMRPNKYKRRGRPNNPYFVQSLLKIVREEGVLALWRGNGAALVHRFPYTAVTFYTNALMRRRLESEPFFTRWPGQVQAFVCGGVGAMVAISLCYPLDVVKTRLTSQTKTKYYKGIVHTLQMIGQNEGVRGFYRGLGVSLSGTTPMLALNFAFYHVFFDVYKPLELPPYMHCLLAGGCSGAISSTMLFPLDLLRRQMQMVGFGGRPAVYANSWEAVKHVYHAGKKGAPRGSQFRAIWGCREFFRGLMPELVKVTPNNALLFCVNAQLLKMRWPLEGDGNIS
eukprot:TRINITY_DN44357_c0_g1_i1.p1 TRINITY_DN44357_c0_g1~~TRINITY_DN44357_c0_g1_i1.p1  ORF type:complete len:374 (-),score=53.97 TRINITY_DN44357_c0_g1_i1:116-1237(-)